MADTSGEDYAERLTTLQGRRWKSLLGAQLPYRWNVRRLMAGRDEVLDVGCGIGRNLDPLGRGVGVDHNAAAVATARAAGHRAWTTEQWPSCPDAVPGRYDALLLAHVLEHLQPAEADALVAAYLPYLAPAARIVAICPQERGYASDATHVRFLDLTAMSQALRGWGFTPVRTFSFPLPRAAGKSFTYNEFVVAADRRA
jgi:2-polyprenyl-3-methyl-5-hydroxy-6-metoxy-1,4-benzoquinol methylase